MTIQQPLLVLNRTVDVSAIRVINSLQINYVNHVFVLVYVLVV